MRTDGNSGSFEWWYADFTFDDGTTVVVAFYSKFLFDTHGVASPMATIDIVYPNGDTKRDMSLNPLDINKKINASTTIADVQIGDSYIKYIDGNYKLHYSNGDISFDAIMTSTLPMWRPETGYIFFGEEKENYFAWLVAQPSSRVEAILSIDGNTKKLQGEGYHDHNWGNSPMHENMNNWYWGRAKVGEYSLIFADIVTQEEYNYTNIPLMMIAKGDQILDWNSDIKVERKQIQTHQQTGKAYANQLIFKQTYKNGQTYTIEVNKKEDLSFMNLNLFPFETGDNPTYLRTLGDIILRVNENNGSSEVHKGLGIIEQMSFNHVVEG